MSLGKIARIQIKMRLQFTYWIGTTTMTNERKKVKYLLMIYSIERKTGRRIEVWLNLAPSLFPVMYPGSVAKRGFIVSENTGWRMRIVINWLPKMSRETSCSSLQGLFRHKLWSKKSVHRFDNKTSLFCLY